MKAALIAFVASQRGTPLDKYEALCEFVAITKDSIKSCGLMLIQEGIYRADDDKCYLLSLRDAARDGYLSREVYKSNGHWEYVNDINTLYKFFSVDGVADDGSVLINLER